MASKGARKRTERKKDLSPAEVEQEHGALKQKFLDELPRNALFHILTEQEITAETLVDSILWFFLFDTQPRHLSSEKDNLLSKTWAGVANVEELPRQVRTLAGKIASAINSPLFNLGFVHAKPLPETQPDEPFPEPLPEHLRDLPTLLDEWAGFAERTIDRETARLTRSGEQLRDQADEVLCNFVESARRQTGHGMFRELAQLLTDAAAILELRTDEGKGEDKIFSDDEVKKRYYRHRKNTVQE
jgi:hypothetical protein